jgi:hypothetical protein
MPENTKKLLLKAFKENPDEFRKEYPIPDAQRAHLLSTFAAGTGGTQVRTPTVGAPLTITSPNVGGEDATPVDLRNFTGNPTERVIAHLKKQDPDFGKLPWKDQIARAGTFRQANAHRIVLA